MMMRTTVSIEPDLARLIERRMAEEGKGFKQILNDTLRRGFEAAVRESPARYEVPTFDSAVLPGIDLAKVNQLLDEESPFAGEAAADSPCTHQVPR